MKKMFDVVINNGSIIDPIEGYYEACIGIKNGKIEKISKKKIQGERIINADGKKVSPGFIDIHMHEDKAVDGKIDYEIFNYMALMGVTTVVGGNCGLGDANIGHYFKIINKQGSPVNYIGLIGHSSLREELGFDDNDRYRSASRNEIEKMCEIIEKGLNEGAYGLSFGLEYNPGTSTEEIMELCKLVTNYQNKIVSAHYRFDAVRSLEAMAEMIIIARETGVKFQISHIGSCTAFGQMKPGLQMLEAAYKAGVDVMADVYPYDAFSTYIGSAVFDEGCFERWDNSYDAIEMAEGKYKGKRCTEEIFNYVRNNEPDSLAIAFVMNEAEVIEAMKHPLVMIASDGLIKNGQGHPRAAGAFPRVLGKYVREGEKLDLITAIKKMTYMPARRLKLESKGRIKEGFDADITIFDADLVIDRATFSNPTSRPEGIINVINSGREVVSGGKLTGDLPGIVIKSQ
jgi:N-acyl-D-amino-acid deacylase